MYYIKREMLYYCHNALEQSVYCHNVLMKTSGVNI